MVGSQVYLHSIIKVRTTPAQKERVKVYNLSRPPQRGFQKSIEASRRVYCSHTVLPTYFTATLYNIVY